MNWFAPSSVTDTAQAAVWMILPALFVANVDPTQILTTKTLLPALFVANYSR